MNGMNGMNLSNKLVQWMSEQGFFDGEEPEDKENAARLDQARAFARSTPEGKDLIENWGEDVLNAWLGCWWTSNGEIVS